jgi:hypothetical protein
MIHDGRLFRICQISHGYSIKTDAIFLPVADEILQMGAQVHHFRFGESGVGGKHRGGQHTADDALGG